MKHVLSYSGGVTSWAAGKLVAQQLEDGDELVLLFADTKMEAPDVYSFLEEGARNIGAPITKLCDGRTPWQVFADERFLGNSRIDPCSRILKRELMDRWRRHHCTPETSRHYVGLDFTEVERYEQHRQIMEGKGWRSYAPLIEQRIAKPQALAWAEKVGLKPPEAYKEGFNHANCMGMCVKAGMHHWATLYRIHPERYEHAEQAERQIRTLIGKNVAILKDRSDGKNRPITLEAFRERIESRCSLPLEDDGGGCGCALEG